MQHKVILNAPTDPRRSGKEFREYLRKTGVIKKKDFSPINRKSDAIVF